jgi:mono/diheme cytochrome c family protein
VTQVWLNDAKMGPLNGEMIHVAYSRPDIFRVMFDKRQRDKAQAAVVEIPLPIKFAPLNGRVNPADGCLYLIGYQIWGTVATEISGLARVRYTGAESTLPCELSPMDKGILVRFDCPVDKTLAADPDNYAVERWNYKRTWDYGSAHYKLDGTTGQELVTASSAYVSEDGRSVFVAVPGLTKCDQMHLGWAIKSASGKPMQHNAYFTPYNFAKFDAAAEGFGKIEVNMTPRAAKVVAAVKPTVEEGQRLYQFVGCMGCHSVDGSVAGRLGPSWKGLYMSKRLLSDDTTVIADEAYLRESILEPSKKKAKAYLKLETGMPIYGGILNDSQIESIILYMKTLAK